MILEHQSLELFGKNLFEKALVKPPLMLPTPMENEACFIFVMEGTGSVVSATEKVQLNSQEAVLLKCGNYLGRIHINEEDSNYHTMVIHLLPDVLKEIYKNEIPSFLKAEESEKATTDLPTIKGNELLMKYIDSILFYFENPTLATEDLLVLKIKELFMLLMHTKNAPEVKRILSQLFSPQIYSMREIVDAHLYDDISVTDLALLSNHSLSSFKRKFKEIYKESTAGYLRKKKLEKAAELLKASADNIGNIAYDCGFNDLAHFSRCFKKKYKLSPSDYRLGYRNKQMA
jgi:AraC-like DNA-binding protein